MAYCFIYRRPNGTLQAAMGQARIPSAAAMLQLIQMATQEGWFVVCEGSCTDNTAATVEEDAE